MKAQRKTGASRGFTAKLLGGLVAAMAVASSGLALAAQNDGQLGGPPATDTATSMCPAGKGVTGASGREGDVAGHPIAASATVQCQDGAAASGSVGSGDTPPGSTACGPGQVAVGIVGREGDFVDQLALRCRASNLTGAIASSDPYPVGGTGGGPDGPYDCPDGQQLSGLFGSVEPDGTLRHLEIRCAAPPSVVVTSPSNVFTVGGLTRNKKRGTATLAVNVPNSGELTGSGNGAKVSRASRATVSKTVAPGTAQLLIKAKGKKKQKLNLTGKVKLNIAVTYTPNGGSPRTQSIKVKLRKKR